MGKITLLVITILLFSCNEAGNKQGSKEGEDPSSTSPALEENCIVVPESFASVPEEHSKAGSDTIIIDQTRLLLAVRFYDTSFYPNLRSAADSAMYIASVLLNSSEFKDSINKLTFTCRNFKRNCEKQCDSCDARFKGSVVLDSAYRKRNVSINLILDSANAGSFGSAAMNTYKITSHFPVIRRDDRSLPFSYSYAYHIAHEYMHIVGFTHTDHKDDVAEKVGKLGYRIIKRWHKRKINPMAVKL